MIHNSDYNLLDNNNNYQTFEENIDLNPFDSITSDVASINSCDFPENNFIDSKNISNESIIQGCCMCGCCCLCTAIGYVGAAVTSIFSPAIGIGAAVLSCVLGPVIGAPTGCATEKVVSKCAEKCFSN